MLGWALAFFVLALVAAYMGFFAMAGLAASIAKLSAGGVRDSFDRQCIFGRVKGPAADLN